MKQINHLVHSLSLAAAFAMSVSIVPAFAQNTLVPCSAFARDGIGGWKVVAPVAFSIEGRVFAPMVGTNFSAGSETRGIKMSYVLDRTCSGE